MDRPPRVVEPSVATARGGRLSLIEPQPEQVSLAEIAQGLANQCRFAGQCDRFYSVAQHSVLVSQLVPPEDAFWALLHDAHEAYIGDLIHPVKSLPEIRGPWKRLEYDVQSAIWDHFGVSAGAQLLDSIRRADLEALAIEARSLFPRQSRAWFRAVDVVTGVGDPGARISHCLDPAEANVAFLRRYVELNERRRVA